MAGQNHIWQNHQWQNHAAPPFIALPAMILSLLRMILSGHDSVGLLRWHKKSSQLANNFDYCITDSSGQTPAWVGRAPGRCLVKVIPPVAKRASGHSLSVSICVHLWLLCFS